MIEGYAWVRYLLMWIGTIGLGVTMYLLIRSKPEGTEDE